MPAKVYYNNIEVIGDPFVSESMSPIDLGNRWGMTESITLNGMLTGVNYCVKAVNGVCERYGWEEVTDTFKVNFQEFKVLENGSNFLTYPSVMVDSIDFPQDKWGTSTCTHCECTDTQQNTNSWVSESSCEGEGLCKDNNNNPVVNAHNDEPLCVSVPTNTFTNADNTWLCETSSSSTKGECEADDYFNRWEPGGAINYTVKLKSYDIFTNDGVIDPSDSYNFVENEDGTINVAHKISAKGVKTNTSAAFNNAINFVNKYKTDINQPDVYFSTFFMGGGAAILLSESESADRMAGSYSLDQSFKIQPKDALGNFRDDQINYLKTSKIDLSESVDADYTSIKYEAQYKTDAAKGMTTLRQDVMSDIGNGISDGPELEIASRLDIPSAQIYRTSFSLNEDENSHSVSYKSTYVTGQNQWEMAKGFFDPTITMTTDEVTNTTIWSIDGQFITKGTLGEKRHAIEKFKEEKEENWHQFLYDTLVGSDLYLMRGPDGEITQGLRSDKEGTLFGAEDGECSIIPTYDICVGEYFAPPPSTNQADCEDGDINGSAGHWYTLSEGDVTESTCSEAGGTWWDYKTEGDKNGWSFPQLTSLKASDDWAKATLSLNATFTDEDRINAGTTYRGPWDGHRFLEEAGWDTWHSKEVGTGEYPLGYPIKYNISITDSVSLHKLLPSATVEGVFVLQNLNCKSKAKAKIGITSSRVGNFDVELLRDATLIQDAKAHVRKNVERTLFENQPNSWRTDLSSDQNIPGTSSSENVEYTYDPSDNTYWDWQSEVFKNADFVITARPYSWVRDYGKKFGF